MDLRSARTPGLLRRSIPAWLVRQAISIAHPLPLALQFGFLLALLLGPLSGCAAFPRLGDPPRVGPSGALAGSRPADPDTLRGTPSGRSSTAARKDRPAAAKPAPGGTTGNDAGKSGSTGSNGGSVAPNGSPGGAPGQGVSAPPGAPQQSGPGGPPDPGIDSGAGARTLSIELPPAERIRLETQALLDIEAARQLAGEAKGRTLAAAEQEKLLTVLGLVGQAEKAIDAQDISAASNLARKARLLAAELIPR